jgi:AcrR family transcriptional regulator
MLRRSSGTWRPARSTDLVEAEQWISGDLLLRLGGEGDALAPLEEAVQGFEWLARQTLERSPQRRGMPAAMVSAHIGAMREIASARLRAGREAELPGLMEELWPLIRSYRPPPAPLRAPPRRRPPARPESLEAHDHAERALRAFAVLIAEQGYAETTVDQVVARAAMSASTFYANFAGKEEALIAAIDSAAAQTLAAALPAARRSGEWATGIGAAIAALLRFLASRPALARLLTVEVYAAGPRALERRSAALGPLAELLAEGYERSPQTPAIALEAIGGGICTLAYRQVRDSGPQSLPALAPIGTYIALAPFVGPEQACAVANGEALGAAPRARG